MSQPARQTAEPDKDQESSSLPDPEGFSNSEELQPKTQKEEGKDHQSTVDGLVGFEKESGNDDSDSLDQDEDENETKSQYSRNFQEKSAQRRQVDQIVQQQKGVEDAESAGEEAEDEEMANFDKLVAETAEAAQKEEQGQDEGDRGKGSAAQGARPTGSSPRAEARKEPESGKDAGHDLPDFESLEPSHDNERSHWQEPEKNSADERRTEPVARGQEHTLNFAIDEDAADARLDLSTTLTGPGRHGRSARESSEAAQALNKEPEERVHEELDLPDPDPEDEEAKLHLYERQYRPFGSHTDEPTGLRGGNEVLELSDDDVQPVERPATLTRKQRRANRRRQRQAAKQPAARAVIALDDSDDVVEKAKPPALPEERTKDMERNELEQE